VVGTIRYLNHHRNRHCDVARSPRQNIDQQLAAVGWVVQNREDINLGRAWAWRFASFRSRPVRRPTCSYVDRKTCGVPEAKPEGVTLTGFEEQSGKYLGAL
jgi:type I restriction enzyme, R subunit